MTMEQNRMFKSVTQAYVGLVSMLSLGALVYIYAFPPESMFKTRDGVPHFTPQVMHPETGKPLSVGELIRHYRGD
jgi:hypothetical protein